MQAERHGLKLRIIRKIPGMTVHWIDGEKIIASRNYSIYISKDCGATFCKIFDVNVSSLLKILSRSRLIERGLRLGIRALLKLRSNAILCIANRRVFRFENGKLSHVFYFERGVGPLRNGLCEDEKGNVYMGEYFLNNSRKYPVKLLKSTDGGRSWEVVCFFRNIRHIHCVQYDPYEKLIWLGTGDSDRESKILFSEDGGESWRVIGSGNQMFRTMSLQFTEDHVYWGTDTPARQSYICRFNRRDGRVEKMVPVNGPVYYSASLENDMMFFSTGAEGKSEKISGAWDNKARIWASTDGVNWQDIISWEKDHWPYILGFGRILFANGSSGNTLAFTTQCVKKADNVLFIAEVEMEK